MHTVRHTCGHCRRMGDFAFRIAGPFAEAVDGLRNKTALSAIEAQPVDTMRRMGQPHQFTGYALGFCPLCNKPSLFLFRTTKNERDNIVAMASSGQPFIQSADVDVFGYYPEAAQPADHPDWPDQTRKLFHDVQSLEREGGSAPLIMSGCRSIFEVLLRQLGAPEGRFKTRVDHLLQAGIITKGMAEWGAAIWKDGSGAAHEIVGTIGQAREMIEFLRMFMDMTFALPAAIDAKKTT